MAARKAHNGNGNVHKIKRVLRHKNSKEYFKDGGWTSTPKDANGFSDVVEVVQICTRYGLNDVELALQFESSDCDVFCTSIR